jgi:ADP-heptose:LPS heptosyltransferase
VKILVLRGGALGDLILTLPALQALRKRFPEAMIRLAGAFPQADLAASGIVDEVENVNGASYAPLFGNEAQLDALRPTFATTDLAINYLSDPDQKVERNLLSLGIRRIVAGPHRPIEKEGAAHASIQLFAPLRTLGMELTEFEPLLNWGSVDRVAGRIALHIGSGSSVKNWPLDRWSQLITEIEPRATAIHVVAGEADKSRLEFVKRSIRSAKVHYVENAPLRQLAELLATCERFAGHDSGVSHLAGAVGISTVALFGPTDPQIWAPRGRDATVIQSPDRRMESITVESVVRALRG